MENTQNRLYEAALEGNVSKLNTLIKEDPLILERITPTFFQDTPLHIATLRGHLEFAKVVLSHGPRLATEPDSLGHLPLHIASAKGHVEITRELLRVGPGSCLARSKDGKLPLHLAIMKAVRVEVVIELARACPESSRLKVDRGDSVLHLCVKHENLDAFRVLWEALKGGSDGSNLFLNARNDDGNTVLHLAALYKHLEITKFLLATPGVELNAVNNNGLTALDLIENSPKDVKGLEVHNFLLQSNVIQRSTNNNHSSSLSPTKAKENTATSYPTPATIRPRKKSWKTFFAFDNGNQHLEDMKGQILITAAIIAAIDGMPIIYMRVNGPDLTDQYITNSISFVPTLAIMVILLCGFSLRNNFCAWLVMQLMYTSLGFLGLNYIGQMISNESRYMNVDVAFVLMTIWFALLSIVSALNMIRFIVWIVKSVKGCMKRRKLQGVRRGNNALSNA